jgi:hypothetical protein
MSIRLIACCGVLGVGVALVAQDRAVSVKIHPERVEAAQAVLPVEPNPRIQIQYVGMMGFGLMVDNRHHLCCGAGAIRTNFKIDERIVYPNVQGKQPLPPGPFNKKRHGQQTAWAVDNLQITQVLEIVPSKSSDTKRWLDTVLIKYVVENNDQRPRRVGVRVHIDTMCGDNDGALFAAPTTHPGKILDGIELKGKEFPDFVQILERPDLKNPGFVGYYTLKMPGKLIGPDRFMATAHAQNDNGWDIPAVKANGDSDCAIFWQPREIQPGAKVEFACAYGRGLATLPENEGRVKLTLSGSFEPGKQFMVTAYVEEPVANQTLLLELPAGLELLEGRELQPVPAPPSGSATSVVTWKARARELGSFDIRIRSSNGVTRTWPITLAR